MKNLDLPLDNLFIPAQTPSKQLLIVLHGRGDSSEGFINLPDFLNIETMNYLLLDAPFEYFGGLSWYQLPPDQLLGIEHSSRLLTETLDTLFEKEFHPSQTFLFGFSQGSLLTFEFGLRYEKVLAGYIAISGYIYDEQRLLRESNPDAVASSWLCTHGRFDNVLPFEHSKRQIEFLQQNGFAIEFVSYDKEHTLDRDELRMISLWIEKRM